MIRYTAGLSLERPSCLMARQFVWRYLTAPDGHRLWINKQRPATRERTLNSTCRKERRRMSEWGADWFARACRSKETKSPPVAMLVRRVTQQWRERGVSPQRSVEKSELRFTTSALTAGVEIGNQSLFPKSQSNHLFDIFTQTQWEVGQSHGSAALSVSRLTLAVTSRLTSPQRRGVVHSCAAKLTLLPWMIHITSGYDGFFWQLLDGGATAEQRVSGQGHGHNGGSNRKCQNIECFLISCASIQFLQNKCKISLIFGYNCNFQVFSLHVYVIILTKSCPTRLHFKGDEGTKHFVMNLHFNFSL